MANFARLCERIRHRLAGYPEIVIEEQDQSLSVKAADSAGFDVILESCPHGLYVY